MPVKQARERRKRMDAGFKDMAADAGLVAKPFYTVAEVSRATGIFESVIRDAKNAGRLKTFLPIGKQRGALFRAEWVDEWIERGTQDAR